jgi:hypothetical protein
MNLDHDFNSLESELWREHTFGDGHAVRIEQPTHLHVSKSGGHRVLDAEGVSHYIPAGWRHLKWKAKDGCKPFDF